MLATANTGKTRKRFLGEKKKNKKKKEGKWTGRVEISKEEMLGSKRSVHGLLTYSRF